MSLFDPSKLQMYCHDAQQLDQGYFFPPIMGGKRIFGDYFPPIMRDPGGKNSCFLPPIFETLGGKSRVFSPLMGGKKSAAGGKF